MRMQHYLKKGIERINRTGWTPGDIGMYDSNAPACLLASMGTEYGETKAVVALADTIRHECDRHTLYGDVQTVWAHNDLCLHTQEDALLILKKALYEVGS